MRTVNVTAVELRTASGADSVWHWGGGQTEAETLHYVANIYEIFLAFYIL